MRHNLIQQHRPSLLAFHLFPDLTSSYTTMGELSSRPDKYPGLGHLLKRDGEKRAVSGAPWNGDTSIDRPRFHVMPKDGWMNDPNGPIQYKGTYHLFFQYVPNSTHWDWGIKWAHAFSKDLVHWEHAPVALSPTPGWWDANGCFSGCCVVDAEGNPTILYTAARRRGNPDAPKPPPKESDLGLHFIESQCAAQPVPGDDMLMKWHKYPEPIIEMAPPEFGQHLMGWRDPFIFQKGGNGKEWGMLIGGGIEDVGGTVLVYKSKNLLSGWKFDRFLCQAPTQEHGKMWECPSLVKLAPHLSQKTKTTKSTAKGRKNHSELKQPLLGESVEAANKRDHLLCISPDAPTNSTICFLGSYVDGEFLLEEAKGPFRLDLGDVLYAPNSFEDEQGRRMLWGWLQEKADVPKYLTYGGCQSVPRLLFIKDEELFQEPAPEVDKLRTDKSWHAYNMDITTVGPLAVGLGVTGHFLDIEVCFEAGAPFVGVKLNRFDTTGSAGIIAFDWKTSKIAFLTYPPASPEPPFHIAMHSNRELPGGCIDLPEGEPLKLRIFIDYSLVEIFTSTGKVLSTRLYRGTPAPGAPTGIQFLAAGGTSNIKSAEVYEMASIWEKSAPSVVKKVEDDVVVKIGKELATGGKKQKVVSSSKLWRAWLRVLSVLCWVLFVIWAARCLYYQLTEQT